MSDFTLIPGALNSYAIHLTNQQYQSSGEGPMISSNALTWRSFLNIVSVLPEANYRKIIYFHKMRMVTVWHKRTLAEKPLRKKIQDP